MMLATKLAGGLNPRRHLKKLVIGQVAASTERFDTINPRAAVLERTRQRFRELAVARDQSMRAHGPAGLRKTVASADL
jgi:hypothetical protein